MSACHSVEIGDNCLFASNILVTDNSHGMYSGNLVSSPEEIPDKRTIDIKGVKIGDNCWIGENVVILPGIILGNGCVVGAGTIVTKSFPDNSIIAGNPAKVIKVYDKEQKKWIKENSRDF